MRHDILFAHKTSLVLSIMLGKFPTWILVVLFTIINNAATRQYYERLEVTQPIEAGMWGIAEFCPNDHFVTGFSVEYQPDQGSQNTVGKWFAAIFSLGISSTVQALTRNNDDNGLTGVYLYCKKNPSDENQRVISSLSNDNFPQYSKRLDDIQRTAPKFCANGFANGFTVNIHPSQGVSDDGGITNFKLKCEDGQMLQNTLSFDPGEELRNAKDTCSPGSAICGLQTKVELTHHDDNTGLNDMVIFCCRKPPPKDESETCDPSEYWQIVTIYENHGYTPTNHQFQIRIGARNTMGNSQLSRASSNRHSEFGFRKELGAETSFGLLGSEIKANLKLRFDQKFGSSYSQESENGRKTEESFDREHTVTQTVDVGPKKIMKVLQKVRQCGPYHIDTIHTKRVDECIQGFEQICKDFNTTSKLAV